MNKFKYAALALAMILVLGGCTKPKNPNPDQENPNNGGEVKENEITVTFKNGAEEFAKETYKEGNNVSEPSKKPSKTGYSFRGWYYDEACTSVATFPFVAGSENVTLYAGFRKTAPTKITLELNGGEADVTSISEFEGKAFTLPTPSKAGYIFKGWYKDPEFTVPFTDTVMKDEDITIYACFEKDENVSTLTIDYGFKTEEVEVSNDSLYELKLNDDNYELDYFEDENGNKLSGSIKVTGDMTIKCYMHSKGLVVRKGILTSYSGNSTVVVLSNNIQIVGNGTNPFDDSSVKDQITKIILNDEVIEIGDDAFAGMKSLEYIHMPKGIEDIGIDVFYGCPNLTTLDYEGNEKYPFVDHMLLNAAKDTVIKYIGKEDDFTIPSTITTIGANAFAYASIKNLTVPQTVKKIEDYAFVGAKFETVSFNAGMTLIPDYSFKDCSFLTEVTINSSIEKVGQFAFSGCTELATLNLGSRSNALELDQFAFEKCSSLKSMDWENVSLINGTVFSFAGIEEYSIADGEEEIPAQMFINWINLETINIPSSVKYIREKAFFGCVALKDVVFGDSPLLEVIESDALAKTGLVNLDLSVCENLTHINNNAFEDSALLETLVVPNNLWYMGDNALYGCSSLRELTLPFVGNYGRLGAKEMLDEIIAKYPDLTPNQILSEIGLKLYTACQSDEGYAEYVTNEPGSSQFVFGRIFGATEFSDTTKCFQYYSSESYYTTYIPNSLEKVTINNFYLNARAFNGISNFTNQVVLPEGMEIIGANAFYNMKNLSEIVLPSTLKTIKERAFAIDVNLKKINFPDSITYMGSDIFLMDNSIEEVKLPNNPDCVYNENVFRDCKSISYIYQDIADREEFTMNLRNGKFYGYFVYNNQSITTAKLGADVELLCYQYSDQILDPRNGLFSAMEALTDVYLPNELKIFYNDKKITTIPCSFFYGCKNLTNVYCAGVESDANIVLPRNITGINYGAFEFAGTNSEFTVDLPESLTSLTTLCFSRSGVKEIDLRYVTEYREYETTTGSSAKKVGTHFFSECTKLEKVILNTSIKQIPDNMFYNCQMLNTLAYYDIENSTLVYEDGKIQLPETITSLGSGAFYNCQSIYHITLPTALETINARLFYKCSNLQEIVIPENVVQINQMAFQESGVESIKFAGNKVVKIGDQFAKLCLNLKSVTFPEGIESIGGETFYGCAILEYVSVPESCREFGRLYAFRDCFNLKTLVMHSTIPPVVDGGIMSVQTLFYNSNTGTRISNVELKERGLKIYIPEESYELYANNASKYGIYTRTITGWKEYKELFVTMDEGLYSNGSMEATLKFDGTKQYVTLGKGFTPVTNKEVEVVDGKFTVDGYTFTVVKGKETLSRLDVTDGTNSYTLNKVSGYYLDMSSEWDTVPFDRNNDNVIDEDLARPLQYRHYMNLYTNGTCLLNLWITNGTKNTTPGGTSGDYCADMVEFKYNFFKGTYVVNADNSITITVTLTDGVDTVTFTVKDGISTPFVVYGVTYQFTNAGLVDYNA